MTKIDITDPSPQFYEADTCDLPQCNPENFRFVEMIINLFNISEKWLAGSIHRAIKHL